MNLTYARACFLTGVAALFLPHASLLGADLQRLTPELVLSLRSAADVALSPDGRDVVYRVDRLRNAQESRGADVGELWRVLATGGSPHRLTEAGFDARLPRWSPDGERIAWIARDNPSSAPQLRIAARDGSAPIVLTGEEGGVQALEWAPDSTRIAYTRLGFHYAGTGWMRLRIASTSQLAGSGGSIGNSESAVEWFVATAGVEH